MSSPLPGDLLTRLPEEAARLIALLYLDAAAAAFGRLNDAADGEALHDFRVALRRLRSTLRAYRPHLAGSAPGKLRRRLRDLARATNAGRDAEVKLAWLQVRTEALTPRQRHGSRWLTERLDDRRRAAYDDLREKVTHNFAKLERRLRDRLGTFRKEVRIGAEADERTHGDVLAGLVREHAQDLRGRLSAVTAVEEDAPAHAARISAKRLRYLIEPVAPHVPEARRIVDRLKELQDLLGELHDVHILGEEIATSLESAAAERARRLHGVAIADDPEGRNMRAALRQDERPGLLALTRAARSREQELFATLSGTWLGGSADAFFQGVEELAGGVAAYGPPPAEIERKYLLSALPAEARDAPHVDIDQGWIPGRRLHERIRRSRSAEGERYYRTVKFGAGVKRLELEEEIPVSVFDGLWPLTEGHRIHKRRHVLPAGDLVFEIDNFEGRELVMAEVELPTEHTEIELPEWLRPYVVREVTGEPEYLNINLAG